jgi:TldD protein
VSESRAEAGVGDEQAEIALRATEGAVAGGAAYADARVVARRWSVLTARNGRLESLQDGDDIGLGVRALVDGASGFAASPAVTPGEADRLAAVAVEVARSSAALAWPTRFEPPEPREDAVRAGRCEIDPFAVPLEQKLELLEACDAAMRAERDVNVSFATLDFLSEERVFVSSAGSRLRQVLVDSGGGLRAIAVRDGRMQQRTFPHLFGWHANRGGWEVVEAMELEQNAARIGAEAAELLTAPLCPEGPATVVLGGSLAAMQLHETVAHALELDRVLGMEAATAGTSFLTTDKLGRYRLGSEEVTVTVDPTTPSALGSFFFDDDGVAARRSTLVERGLLVDYLSSCDTASAIGRSSTGCSRAESWNRLPLVRITAVDLEPGERSFEDLLGDVDSGFLLDCTRSWSTDDRRVTFEFAAEAAWEIESGELRRLRRGPIYRGVTPEFWQSCDGVADRASWQTYGLGRCFKGQPGQLVRVSHGTAPARFQGVELLAG